MPRLLAKARVENCQGVGGPLEGLMGLAGRQLVSPETWVPGQQSPVEETMPWPPTRQRKKTLDFPTLLLLRKRSPTDSIEGIP